MSEFGPEFVPDEVKVESTELTLLQGGKQASEVLSKTEFYIKQHNQFIDGEIDAKGDFLPMPLWQDGLP